MKMIPVEDYLNSTAKVIDVHDARGGTMADDLIQKFGGLLGSGRRTLCDVRERHDRALGTVTHADQEKQIRVRAAYT